MFTTYTHFVQLPGGHLTVRVKAWLVCSVPSDPGVSGGAARSGRGLSAPARPAGPPPAAASCPPAPGPARTTPPPPAAAAAAALPSSSGPACPTLLPRVVAVIVVVVVAVVVVVVAAVVVVVGVVAVVVVVAAAPGPPRAGSRWRERPSSSATPQSPAAPGKYFICHELTFVNLLGLMLLLFLSIQVAMLWPGKNTVRL